MPNWGEHLLIANKILKKVKIDENLFLFGNILPDVQNGFLVKDISNIVSHKVSHYYLNEKYSLSNHKKEYENFYKIYYKRVNNPIIMGYLSHLITDSLWNDMFYNKKCIKEDDNPVGFINRKGELIKGTKSELKEYKQKEFKIFQTYIYKNYKMKLPKFALEVSKNANILENININDDDVKKVVEYINKTKIDSNNQNHEMQLFTIEELEKQINNTVDFIYFFLNDKKIL